MDYHSSDTHQFPLSITSSMEKGALNRYDNIWPYEYSRVKLNNDHYINANHIQFSNIKKNITASPIKKSENQLHLEKSGLLSEASVRTMTKTHTQDLTSTRPYICTQAPLPTTFNDFWKMIWDNQVPVIVMITQEFEFNKVKKKYSSQQMNTSNHKIYRSSVIVIGHHPCRHMDLLMSH